MYVESRYYISCLINAFSTSNCIHEVFTTSFVSNTFEITMLNANQNLHRDRDAQHDTWTMPQHPPQLPVRLKHKGIYSN